jgi:hypothetical protein
MNNIFNIQTQVAFFSHYKVFSKQYGIFFLYSVEKKRSFYVT